MVKFVTHSPFSVFHKPKRKTSKDNSNIFTTAKFGKSSNCISKASKLRIISESGDFDNKTAKILQIQRNEDSYRSKLKITASEYWKDAYRNQWLLALQGIVLIIVILTMGAWIEHECKVVVDDNPVATWRLAIKRLQETIIDVGTKLRPCYDVETDTPQKRRASVLRRRRIFVNG
ncbi:uncharacterized protein [Linepithema humile]|uniref:uncharacterized protein n=1 Tax=Linepithema humile TaxID=83485 RepID=UPI00351EB576